MAGLSSFRGTMHQKNSSRAKSRNTLGQGQFSIYLPRMVDAEYYVRSPVKVRAEMLLSPEHLGGRSVGSIPCRARAEKLTTENGLSVVNVPIKIEAELLLTPCMSFSCRPASPQSPTPQDIHEGSLQETKPLKVAESWELWGKKMKVALSKYRSQYGVKSEDLWQTKQVLVSELRVDNSYVKTKELTKRIDSYAAQVCEQNKKIRLLQIKLREEEGGRAESSEKFSVIEQQCRLLEKRLKAAESRAIGAEHQAEAIKLRTRDLGVVCGHQGVQLKELAKQVDFFANILATQKLAALNTYKALEQQLAMHPVFVNERMPTADDATSSQSGDSTFIKTRKNRYFKIRSPLVKQNPQPLNHKILDLYRSENQHLLPTYSISTCKGSSNDQIMTPRSMPRPNSEHSEGEEEVPHNHSHLGLFLNQLMHFAPNWDVEFNSSMKRAEELVQQCAFQASKLKNLSAELDCLGTKTKRDRKPNPKVAFYEPQVYEIRSDSIESSPFRQRPSSKPSIPSAQLAVTAGSVQIFVKDVTFGATLSSPVEESSVDKPVLHKFTVIAREERTLESPSKKPIDRGTQTLPVSPLVLRIKGTDHEEEKNVTGRRKHLPMCSQCQTEISRRGVIRRAPLLFRYELKLWRLAGRTLMQASMLWFGIHLLPQLQLFHFIPPAT